MHVGFEWNAFHSAILSGESLVSDWEQQVISWGIFFNAEPNVRAIVCSLRTLCGISDVSIPSPLSVPAVYLLCSCEAPLPPQYLYVGAGCQAFPLKLSPWLNLFNHLEGAGLELYRAYVSSRPDYSYFLGFIAKAIVLVCDCPCQ